MSVEINNTKRVGEINSAVIILKIRKSTTTRILHCEDKQNRLLNKQESRSSRLNLSFRQEIGQSVYRSIYIQPSIAHQIRVNNTIPI